MVSAIIEFLVMLNPFALFLYLQPVMHELPGKDFKRVLMFATIISFFIFLIFLFTGDIIFETILQIEFEAFRIFGGIIVFSYAYFFIVKGQKALIQMKGSLDNLASEIALPFMVGAGTIPLTILMGYNLSPIQGMASLVIILITNFLVIIGLKTVRDRLPQHKLKVAFDKNMEILLRLNGFFLGAIGVNMIIGGIKNVFLPV